MLIERSVGEELNMNIQQLIYVNEINRHNSFSIAANALYISQPRLSQAVKDLEKELGFDIFERSRKGIVGPTVQGYEFIKEAKKVLRSFNALEYFKGNTENSFRMTTTLLPVAQDSFTELVNEYIDEEDMNFELWFCGCYESADKVKNSNYNLGVITIIDEQLEEWMSYFKNQELEYTDIINSSFYITIHKDSPLASYECIKREDLVDYLYVTEKCSKMNSLTLQVYNRFDSLFSSSRVTVSNTDVMYSIVRDNKAFTLDSLKLDERTAEKYSLVSIPFDNILKCHVGIIKSKNPNMPHIAEKYIEILKKNINKFVNIN